MKCKDCGHKMILMDKKTYNNNKEWKPQSYVCENCGVMEYI